MKPPYKLSAKECFSKEIINAQVLKKSTLISISRESLEAAIEANRKELGYGDVVRSVYTETEDEKEMILTIEKWCEEYPM